MLTSSRYLLRPLDIFQYSHRLALLIWSEFQITCLLLHSNASISIGEFLTGLLGRWGASPTPVKGAPLLFKVLVASVLYAYAFDIANQTTSVAEDAVNKPYRPLPAGHMSVRGAYWRWGFSWIWMPILAFVLSGKWAAIYLIYWEIWIFFCYVWPKINNPFMRNIFPAMGNVCLVRMLNAIVVEYIPSSNMSWKLDSAICIWSGLTIHIQEFHDVDGDRKSGRRTIPIVLTPKQIMWVRQVTAVFLIGSAATFLMWGLSVATEGQSLLGLKFFGILQYMTASVTAYRFAKATPETSRPEHEFTYKGWYLPTGLILQTYLSYLHQHLSLN